MMNIADNPHLHKTDVSRSTLFWADCFDVFPSIPDKSIDAIIADLPYGTTACKWDSILPLDKLWKEYKRILKALISDLEDIQIKIYKEAKEQKQHRSIARAQQALRVRFSNIGNRSDY